MDMDNAPERYAMPPPFKVAEFSSQVVFTSVRELSTTIAPPPVGAVLFLTMLSHSSMLLSSYSAMAPPATLVASFCMKVLEYTLTSLLPSEYIAPPASAAVFSSHVTVVAVNSVELVRNMAPPWSSAVLFVKLSSLNVAVLFDAYKAPP
jgi:hypothetical protein